MEEVEGLPIETVYNLIHANVMSLEEFIEWINYKDRESVLEGISYARDEE